MKKYLYLAAALLAMAACQPKENNNPEDPNKESVIPQQIRLADAFQEYFMSEGETALIQYTVTPSNVNVTYTLACASSDEKVVKVDSKGKVTAVAAGSATVTVSINEYPEVKAAEAHITVLAPAKVGDYIYSDGSWGSDANPSGKSVIAVVYWVGNASLFDPILEQDYPNCTHGLAMSIKQGAAGQWMRDFDYYFYNTEDLSTTYSTYKNMGNSPLCDESGSLTEWGVKHSSYADKIRPYFENKDLWAGDLFPGLGGYTYTAVLEQYTREYDPEGKFPFEFYINAMNLVKDIEAPYTTSRWYVPSVFEAALMVNTALTSPKDFNNNRDDDQGNPLVAHNNANVAVINAALSKVNGADLLPTDQYYCIASATDSYAPYSSVSNYLECAEFFECFSVVWDADSSNATKKAAADKAWDEWLKANAGDKYAEYAAYHPEENEMKNRIQVWLKIKGHEDLDYDKLRSDMLGFASVSINAHMYGNVCVTDGKWHPVITTYPEIEELKSYSAWKGENNERDVVRAIIAF